MHVTLAGIRGGGKNLRLKIVGAVDPEKYLNSFQELLPTQEILQCWLVN